MYDKIFSKCNSKIVRVIVSILALFILFQMIDIGNTFSAFSKINLAFVPLVFLLIIGSIGIYVLNYFVFLRRLSFLKGSTLSRSFREYIYIWSIGLFLPGKIGELGVIPLLKHKHKVPYKFGSLAVGLPKVMMVIVLLCVVFLFGIGLEQFNEWILLTGIIALILCVLFVIIWFFRKDFILQFKICAGLYDSRKELLFFVKPRQIIELILVTVIRFLLVVFSFILLFLAFGFAPSFFVIAFTVALSQVISFVPISLNGLGIREASFTGALIIFGVSSATAVSVVLISLALNYGFAIIIILMNLLKNNISLRKH